MPVGRSPVVSADDSLGDQHRLRLSEHQAVYRMFFADSVTLNTD